MAKQTPQHKNALTPEDVRLLHAQAHGLHATWELSITTSEPCGCKTHLNNLRNFVKPNRPAVTWRKLGLTESEVKKIKDAMLYHSIIQPQHKKRKLGFYRRAS